MNKKEILNLIKETKEGLRILNETQAFELLLKKNDELEETFIIGLEKKFDDLLKKEKDALEVEDFIELKNIKEEQKEAARKLSIIFEKKTENYHAIYSAILTQLSDLDNKGDKIFKDKEIHEFKNEDFQKEQSLKIVTSNSETTLIKHNDNNVYQVVSSNIAGINADDLFQLPDLKIGSGGKVKVYRKVNGKFEEIKEFEYNNVRKLVKNPQ